MGLLARLGNWLAPKPDGEVARPAVGYGYLQDTRAGHIASRPTILREHRDEIRLAWDRSAGLALDLIHNSGRLKGACDQILADTVGNELTCNPQPDLTGLGYSEGERDELISLIKQWWKRYAWNPAECDFRGKLTVPQMADIGVRWWIAYGESTGIGSYMGPADRARYGIRSGSKLMMVSPTLANPAFAAGVKLGIYTAVCTTGGADATSKFRVEDPEGVTIGTATGGAAFNKVVKFTIAGGGTAFVAGDRFNVTVSQAAGSDDGKLVPWDPDASDGSEVLCGFSLRALEAPDGEDKLGLVYIRRTALLAGGAVRWPEGLSAAATATAIRDVEARLGIVIRT